MAGAVRGQADPRTTPARCAASDIRGKRILYVDDDRLLRRAARRLLHGAGATCLLAGTHDQALALVAGEPELALAILDFHMPDGSVGHLVTRLRIARPMLPLIGTSGAERRSEFAQHGVTQFLWKPWQLADLARPVALLCPSTPRVRLEIPLDPWIPGQFPHD
jgi:CheY-like chemotaxis protein